MELETAVKILIWSIVGIVIGFWVVHGVWRARSHVRIKQAGPRPLRASRHRIWRDPGPIEQLDLAQGDGGPDRVPVPPFRFVEEHGTGSSPCVSVDDARGVRWRVKWGAEVRSETLATRLAWALGYFVETTHYVARGRIEEVGTLVRARDCISQDCTFSEARFEIEERGVRKMFEEHGWAWNDNPFVGTRELQGLKILLMLLSNWDNKDVRDVARGSNTAIFQYELPEGTEARYLITDWGGSMGRWGSTPVSRGKWDCEGYVAQTPQFVLGVQQGIVRFGFSGQRTADAATAITVEDVDWFCRRASRLSDAQIRAALVASGATDDEADRFAQAIRHRLEQLERVRDEGDAYEAAPAAAAAQT